MPKTKEQRIDFIKLHINKVPVEIRREVGRLIHESGVKLHECAEGSVIDMNLLNSSTVLLIYRYMKFARIACEVDNVHAYTSSQFPKASKKKFA